MNKTIPITALVLLLAACGGERADAPRTQAAAAPSTASSAAAPAPAPATAPLSLTAHAADGAEALTVNQSGSAVDVSWTEKGQKHTARGEQRESGKRKYSVDGAAVEFEVKPNEEGGFKLRTSDGTLLWKVKVTSEKIKISSNEENENPFELKVKEGDRVKVVAPGDRELGNVRFDRGASKLKVENAAGQKMFEVMTDKPGGGWGVLLLDSIPAPQRAILVAEILSRGR